MLIPLLFIVPKGDGARSRDQPAAVAPAAGTVNGDAPLSNGVHGPNGFQPNGVAAEDVSEAAAAAAGEVHELLRLPRGLRRDLLSPALCACAPGSSLQGGCPPDVLAHADLGASISSDP